MPTPDMPLQHPLVQPLPARETGLAASVGRWIHRHKESPENPVGFTTYQVIRNGLAAIPYGIATAAVWDGFEKMTKSATAAESPNLAKFLRSPVRDVAMIAAGFTLYRGTLKLVKYVKDDLFDPKDSEQQTIDEVRNIGPTIAKHIKEIAPAEVNSTPYGAIALGLGRRFAGAIEGYGARDAAHVIAAGKHPRTLHFSQDGNYGLFFSTPDGKKGFGNWLKDLKNRVVSPKSMPVAEALTFIGAFLAFFELSDRLYKDVQVRRGVWQGEDNSLARQAPPKHPELTPAAADAQADHRGKHPETFGGDPSPKSFLFGRILPTILGIGAYTITKRTAYHTMGHFAAKPTFWKRATVEGAATSTFFVMTSSADLFEKLNKKLFGAKEPAPATPNLIALRPVLAESASVEPPQAVVAAASDITQGTIQAAPEKAVASA